MLSFLNCEKSHFNALRVSLSPPPRHPTFIPPYALIISWSMSNPDIQHYILNIFNSSYHKFCFSEVSTSRQEPITSLMTYTNFFQWSSFAWVDSGSYTLEWPALFWRFGHYGRFIFWSIKMTVICVTDEKKNMYNNDFDRIICHLNLCAKKTQQKLDCFEKKYLENTE